MSIDPFSDILYLIDARGVVSTGLKATGQWSMQVGSQEGLKFNAVLEGECWLQVEGNEPILLRNGDCFLLTQGFPFAMATDLALSPQSAEEVFSRSSGHFARLDAGDGNEFSCIGGRMQAANGLDLLVEALPRLVLLREVHEAAGRVRWLLTRLVDELDQDAPGSRVMSSQIMQMIFVEMIRAVPAFETGRASWLQGLFDRQISKALQLIHSHPARTWRLADLASACNMSRSRFSARFHATVGMAPIEYVLNWRMALARRALRRGQVPLSQIAREVGYASESAFGAAFKRVHGASPKRYAASIFNHTTI
ncbi:MAG: AraC family transcriptional regulator [Rhodobacteraceae bacterium]|nr:AraC family transcriptional regulator [Paracoccaceae bacterium]